MKRSSALLLDTHVWLWLAEGVAGQFTSPALRKIERIAGSQGLLVSIISVWEISLLAKRQRILLSLPLQAWCERALARPEIRLVPLDDPGVVIDSVQLPGVFHADPADRFLVATARTLGATLVTRDREILKYALSGHVRALAV